MHDRRLTAKKHLVVETSTGIIEMQLREDERVEVNMGAPALHPKDIPFSAPEQASQYTLQLPEQQLLIGATSMGNPHAVTLVEDVDRAAVAELGPVIEHHPDFPQQVNAGFMQLVSATEIRLRVFERGVGETQACGSGACAAVVVGRLQGLLDERVQVHLVGGDLEITWAGEGQPVMMTGPATKVFEGNIRL